MDKLLNVSALLVLLILATGQSLAMTTQSKVDTKESLENKTLQELIRTDIPYEIHTDIQKVFNDTSLLKPLQNIVCEYLANEYLKYRELREKLSFEYFPPIEMLTFSPDATRLEVMLSLSPSSPSSSRQDSAISKIWDPSAHMTWNINNKKNVKKFDAPRDSTHLGYPDQAINVQTKSNPNSAFRATTRNNSWGKTTLENDPQQEACSSDKINIKVRVNVKRLLQALLATVPQQPKPLSLAQRMCKSLSSLIGMAPDGEQSMLHNQTPREIKKRSHHKKNAQGHALS